MDTAKVFMNGRSQAIRLPKEYRVKGSRVFLRRVPEGILISEADPWDASRKACRDLSAEVLDALEKRAAPPLPERNWKGVFR